MTLFVSVVSVRNMCAIGMSLNMFSSHVHAKSDMSRTQTLCGSVMICQGGCVFNALSLSVERIRPKLQIVLKLGGMVHLGQRGIRGGHFFHFFNTVAFVSFL